MFSNNRLTLVPTPEKCTVNGRYDPSIENLNYGGHDHIVVDLQNIKSTNNDQPNAIDRVIGSNCSWMVYSNNYLNDIYLNKQIELDIKHFIVNNCDDCNCGSLDIYALDDEFYGPDDTYPSIWDVPRTLKETLCVTNSPLLINIEIKYGLLIHFHTDRYLKKLEIQHSSKYLSGMFQLMQSS